MNGDASTLQDQRIPTATCESDLSAEGGVAGAELRRNMTTPRLFVKPLMITQSIYRKITASTINTQGSVKAYWHTGKVAVSV